MSELPDISVVIPTRNRSDALADALRAILAGEHQAYEVLVMDQSDDDRTERVVTALGDARFRYHRMPRPGACPARNYGAALGRAPLVAFLDDDCCPTPTWLARIVAAFAADPELQFIFGQLKAPPNDGREGWFPDFLPDRLRAEGKRPDEIAMVAAGANMSCRKELLRRLGGFDELLGPAEPTVKGNDSSISYKVARSGLKWDARSDIEVIHTHGFRPYHQLASLLRGYAFGIGVNYARFLRRGDLVAGRFFLHDNLDFLRAPVSALLHGRRPSGIGYWAYNVAGLARGLMLSPTLGYVDGAVFALMERTGQLI